MIQLLLRFVSVLCGHHKQFVGDHGFLSELCRAPKAITKRTTMNSPSNVTVAQPAHTLKGADEFTAKKIKDDTPLDDNAATTQKDIASFEQGQNRSAEESSHRIGPNTLPPKYCTLLMPSIAMSADLWPGFTFLRGQMLS